LTSDDELREFATELWKELDEPTQQEADKVIAWLEDASPEKVRKYVQGVLRSCDFYGKAFTGLCLRTGLTPPCLNEIAAECEVHKALGRAYQ
jgi:hypothetical protein